MSSPGLAPLHVEKAQDETPALALTICVCTYRRPELRDTLASIAAQQLPEGLDVEIVVVDNDASPDRQNEITTWFRALGLDGRYIHAPKQNISIARNACLDAATSKWVAFIDDDEIAPPDWILKLLNAHDGFHCVFGVSKANYARSGAPKWMVEGDFHSNRILPRDGIANGYTCNTLLDLEFIRAHELRFREDLGQVGGEDTMFFRAMEKAGGRFRINEDAVVHEDVPPRRAKLKWLVDRAYRSGQNHFEVLLGRGHKPPGIAVSSVAKAGFFCALAALQFFDRKAAVASYLRGVLHWGAGRRAMGVDFIKEYG